MNNRLIWHNGWLVASGEANVSVATHAIHYGTAVFEGIRSYSTESGPSVFRLDAHLRRLFESAATYEIDIPYSLEELTSAVCQVVRSNNLSDSYIRPIAYMGDDHLGLKAHCGSGISILAFPWENNHHSASASENGLRVTISPWVKFDSKMMPATAKASGQYINSRLAVRDAEKRGFDEAILLDSKGNIAEGAVENVFIVHGNSILTNDESSPILMGITRDSVIQIARNLGFEVRIGILTLDDLYSATEAFFTGTASEIVPVVEVDGRKIGSGKRGPVTKQLQDVFFSIVRGKNEKYAHWLYPVAEAATQSQS